MPYSCKISFLNATEYIQKAWGTPQDGVNVVVWFYDTMDKTANNINFLMDHPTAQQVMIGIYTDVNANYYVWFGAGAYHVSSILRTLGWHKFELDYSGSGVVGRIDGTQIFSYASPSTFSYVICGSVWGGTLHGSGYWDDWDAGALGSDNFESCDLAGWTLVGSPECSSEQDHTGAPPAVARRPLMDGLVVF